jgi:hypothetical protein
MENSRVTDQKFSLFIFFVQNDRDVEDDGLGNVVHEFATNLEEMEARNQEIC